MRVSPFSAISAPVGEDELEIEIKHIGKKLKISEITEDIEQRMTDEEYKVDVLTTVSGHSFCLLILFIRYTTMHPNLGYSHQYC